MQLGHTCTHIQWELCAVSKDKLVAAVVVYIHKMYPKAVSPVVAIICAKLQT